MENIVRKKEIACNKQFLLFSQCFLPYTVLIFHFKCTFKCHLQVSYRNSSFSSCFLQLFAYSSNSNHTTSPPIPHRLITSHNHTTNHAIFLPRPIPSHSFHPPPPLPTPHNPSLPLQNNTTHSYSQ